MASTEEQIAQLEMAIAAQEALRATLGEELTSVTLASLRARLDSLRAQSESVPKTPVAESEYKQVTVVFADLSGFTALGEQMQTEAVAELTDEVLKYLSEAVYEYSGYVDKFIGDCIMAVFGAPVAQEDDPECALRAALAMRERIEEFNRRRLSALREPLAIHIGVSTGPVVAGNVGPTQRLAYTVMGDPVNTASRLEEVAGPGQILVSGDTYRLTEEAFQFHELTPLILKGKRDPLRVYDLQRARMHPGKSRGVHGLSSALIGRDDERAVLREVSEALLAGAGSLVTLSGEAGYGKSRLLADWRAEISDRVNWLEGRAFVHTTAVAYGPFGDMIRQCADIGDDASEAEAHRCLEALAGRYLPDENVAAAIFANVLGMRLTAAGASILADMPGERLRQRLFALVEAMLRRLGEERPTVLVLEDLHWADRSSMELAGHLLEITRDTRLIIVAVFRLRPDLPRDNQELLASAAASCRQYEIVLGPLSEQASRAMVQRLLSLPELPAALEQIVLSKAEGNPFFVEELIRALIDRGALVTTASGQGWTTTPMVESVTVPDTLHGVLMARLDRLPAETKRVVQQAAVIGRVFLYRILRHIARNGDGLDHDLSRLAREQLIRERTRDPEVEYMFQHALTQEAAYQSLLGARRREFHHQVGAAMEAIFNDRLGEFSGIVAEHFLRGEDWEKAARYFIQAGDAATRMYAHAEARLHYIKAAEALAALPDSEDNRRSRVDTLVKEASVSFLRDGPERQYEHLSQVEALADTLPVRGDDDLLRLARIRFWMGHALFYGNRLPEATACFEQVRRAAQSLGDTELDAIASSTLGRVVFLRGRFDQAEPLLSQAIGQLERGASWREWVYTVGWHGISLAMAGRVAEGRAAVERAMSRATETNYLPGIAAVHIHHSILSFISRDDQRMWEDISGTVHVAEQAGEMVALYVGLGFRAWAESRLGRHADSKASFTEMRALADRVGGNILVSDWLEAAYAEALLGAGDAAGALRHAEWACENARAVGSVFSEGLAERAWANALAVVAPDQTTEAAMHMEASVLAFEAGGAVLEAARTRADWADIRCRKKELAAAQMLLADAAGVVRRAGLAAEADRIDARIAEISMTMAP